MAGSVRRVILTAGCCLGTGLAISVAAAVAIGVSPGVRAGGATRVTLDMDHPYGSGWLMTCDELGWCWTIRARAVVTPAEYGVSSSGGGGAEMLLRLEAGTDPRYPRLMAPEEGDDVAAGIVKGAANLKVGTVVDWPIQVRLGWPARCLAFWADGLSGWGRSATAWGSARPLRLSGGYELGSSKTPLVARAVPGTPLWGGLALDSAAYGGALFGALMGARHWRQARRARTGRCVSCGYEIGGLAVCPECGRCVGAG